MVQIASAHKVTRSQFGMMVMVLKDFKASGSSSTPKNWAESMAGLSRSPDNKKGVYIDDEGNYIVVTNGVCNVNILNGMKLISNGNNEYDKAVQEGKTFIFNRTA